MVLDVTLAQHIGLGKSVGSFRTSADVQVFASTIEPKSQNEDHITWNMKQLDVSIGVPLMAGRVRKHRLIINTNPPTQNYFPIRSNS